MSSSLLLGVMLAVSFALSLVPGGSYLLYPFKIYTTWAHECSHALTAALLGGEIKKITLAPDTSGLTYYRLPPGRARQGLISSMGYLGSGALGCAIFYASRKFSTHLGMILIALSVLLFLSCLIWVRGFFGILATLFWGAALFGAGWTIEQGQESILRVPVERFLLPFLAVQTSLNSLFDLRVLLLPQRGARNQSDAQVMSKLFWLPSWFWALLWIALSVGMIILTLRSTGILV